MSSHPWWYNEKRYLSFSHFLHSSMYKFASLSLSVDHSHSSARAGYSYLSFCSLSWLLFILLRVLCSWFMSACYLRMFFISALSTNFATSIPKSCSVYWKKLFSLWKMLLSCNVSACYSNIWPSSLLFSYIIFKSVDFWRSSCTLCFSSSSFSLFNSSC